MTTIVFDGRYLAVDSQATHDDVKQEVQKFKELVTPSGDKCVAVFCGHLHAGRAGVAALEAGESVQDALDGDTTLLVVSSSGARLITEEGTWCEEGPLCLGSGRLAAYAGLRMGMRADAAVALACDVDIYSSGPVQCWDVKTMRAIKPRKYVPRKGGV